MIALVSLSSTRGWAFGRLYDVFRPHSPGTSRPFSYGYPCVPTGCGLPALSRSRLALLRAVPLFLVVFVTSRAGTFGPYKAGCLVLEQCWAPAPPIFQRFFPRIHNPRWFSIFQSSITSSLLSCIRIPPPRFGLFTLVASYVAFWFPEKEQFFTDLSPIAAVRPCLLFPTGSSRPSCCRILLRFVGLLVLLCPRYVRTVA